jgi:hypothetical protein
MTKAAADSPPPVGPPAAEPDETSAGVVRRGPKTKREIGLEKRLSEMEDEKAQNLIATKELQKTVDAARRAPSARIPGKSVWDELQSFLGWGS